MQTAGKIRHSGLSEVAVEQIQAARQIAPIVSVQNLYNLVNRAAEPVFDYCGARVDRRSDPAHPAYGGPQWSSRRSGSHRETTLADAGG